MIFTFLFLSSCKKAGLLEKATDSLKEKKENTLNVYARNGVAEIKQWLEEQERIIGRDSNNTVEKIIAGMLTDEIYTEPYGRETFLIVPLDKRMPLTNNIRTDLNEPLRYLLMAEDTLGRISRGAIILFYPGDVNLSRLPANSFHDYFINQSMRIEGTFSMISLMDIKQYEMDFDANGKRKEQRLWCAKPTILEPVPDQPICIDWYLTTTIFYSDGTTQYFEEYLYTTCYENPESGGGGGVYSPANQQGESFTRDLPVTKSDNSHYSITYTATVSGVKFTNNSSNYYTSISSPPVCSFIRYGPSSEPNQPYYSLWTPTFSFSFLANPQTINNQTHSRAANVGFKGELKFPNSPSLDEHVNRYNTFLASEYF